MDLTNTINQLGIQINTLEEELGSKSSEYINWRRKLNILKTRLSINERQLEYKNKSDTKIKILQNYKIAKPL